MGVPAQALEHPDTTLDPITPRDYFAAQALTAILMASNGEWTNKQAAAEAWRMADSMLEERDKPRSRAIGTKADLGIA